MGHQADPLKHAFGLCKGSNIFKWLLLLGHIPSD